MGHGFPDLRPRFIWTQVNIGKRKMISIIKNNTNRLQSKVQHFLSINITNRTTTTIPILFTPLHTCRYGVSMTCKSRSGGLISLIPLFRSVCVYKQEVTYIFNTNITSDNTC